MSDQDPTSWRSDDPVPDEVSEAAKAVFSAAVQYEVAPPGELATLAFDSLVDGDDHLDAYHLLFEHPQMSVRVDISVVSGDLKIIVEVTPVAPTQGVLSFHDFDVSMVAVAQERRLVWDSVPHGLARLSFEAGGGVPAVRTDWFRI